MKATAGLEERGEAWEAKPESGVGWTLTASDGGTSSDSPEGAWEPRKDSEQGRISDPPGKEASGPVTCHRRHRPLPSLAP